MQQAENNSVVMENSHLLYTALVLFLQCIGKLSQEGDREMRECLFKEGIITSSICKFIYLYYLYNFFLKKLI